MVLVTASEFRKNQRKYLQIALTEKVGVKSGSVVFEITPSRDIKVNPSPDGDAFWDNTRNLNVLEQAVAQVAADRKAGKDKEYPTWEEVKKSMNL